MNTTDPDPARRLSAADPLRGRTPDDPSSPAAARVLDRALMPEPAGFEPAREHRLRASRALPALALAAAVLAVVGLSLPKGAPDPVQRIVGAEPASADRAKLMRVAEATASADDDPAVRAKQQAFLDRLGPYPDDPTSEEVLAWLDDNCAAVNEELFGDHPAPDLDCGLLAAPQVVNAAPAPVAADLLRALATLDLGLPTHAQRCADWASVDPAWKAKVEEAEAGSIWIKRNGTLLVIDTLTDEQRAGLEQQAQDLAATRVGAGVSPASPASEVFVQCEPSSALADRHEDTVEGAMGAYAEEHGDACSLSDVELQGLIAVDLAQACQTGAGSEAQPDRGPNPSDGPPTTSVTPLDETSGPTVGGPGVSTTTSVGG
jgi:hypothetical protein